MLEREKKELARAALGGDDDDEITLEEKIEEERAALPSAGLTPVTLETFADWKLRKAERKQKELEERMREEEKKGASKGRGILSGRALFKYDPTLFKDDDNAADERIYEEREEDYDYEEEEKKQSSNQEESKGGDSTHASEMVKSSVQSTMGAEEGESTANVDTELFQQQDGEQEEEEPDFD